MVRACEAKWGEGGTALPPQPRCVRASEATRRGTAGEPGIPPRLSDLGEELPAPEHALELVPPLLVGELLDRRQRRVAGELLDAEMAVGLARDRREMRDHDDLRARGEPGECLRDRSGG